MIFHVSHCVSIRCLRDQREFSQDFVDKIETSRTQETREDLHRILQTNNNKHSRKAHLTHLSQSHNLPCKSGWNNGGRPTLVRNRNAPTGSCCNCRAHTLARPGPRATGTWGHCRARNTGTWCEHEIVVVVVDNSFNKTKKIQQQLLVELCFSMCSEPVMCIM